MFILQVFSPAKVIFAGTGVLLLVSTFLDLFAIARRSDVLESQAAKDVRESQDALVDVFERVENFLKRLETYTEAPPTAAMTDMIVKIMVEVLVLRFRQRKLDEGEQVQYVDPGWRLRNIIFSYFLREVFKEAGREDRPRGCAQEA